MHLGEELVVLGLLLLIAYVLGRLGSKVGLPAIPIYMIVGLAASPYTGWFPLSFESGNIELIAVFGLILLLFNLGLEFDQDAFFSNAGKLLISGGSYILVNMSVGFAFGFLVGWGSREALIIAGITATSSSAIVTKLLIELKRLPNAETPMILGVTVVEDIFIAIYLAIVSVVLSGETEIWPVIGKLGVAFLFLVTMFSLARWGGKVVSRLIRTKDDELFTILFFGLALLFGGIGELLGVTDAIGAFLIGLVLGATRFRNRIEQLSLPMRDLFGAFFFLNFGLTLNVTTFGAVVVPVLLAVLMTVSLNIIAGQFVARINGLGVQAGINATVILQNRGEFALILATLSLSAGLDERIVPFAGLYVLIMSIGGPVLAANSERIGGVILGTKKKRLADAARDRQRAENIALVEAATAAAATPPAPATPQPGAAQPSTTAQPATPKPVSVLSAGGHVDADGLAEFDDLDRTDASDPFVAQADAQSDAQPTRPRDPEY
ncbi:cation:proton antiporter [Marisediminicola senii]|uniref:cation:proton antiporter n=1 Tax=Marisediminicola senii TaxID=2711233 RepID=UPI0013EB4828|nr:cation:proton antiporter [Marisediminicola senii]